MGGGPRESGKRHSWAAFPDWLQDIPYHMMSRSVYKLGGKLAGGRLGIGQLVVSDYFSFASPVFLSSSLWFIYLLFSFSLKFIIIILFQLLNCPYLNTYFFTSTVLIFFFSR